MNKKNDFFETSSSINTYMSSQVKWVKIYQYYILVLTIASTFVAAYMINYKILSLPVYNIVAYFILVFYAFFLCANMYWNLSLTSAKLKISFVWMIFYTAVIVGVNVFVYFLATKNIVLTRDNFVNVSIAQIITTVSLTIGFRVWLHFSEGLTNPIFQNGVKYKIGLILFEFILSIVALIIYKKGDPVALYHRILDMSMVSWIFLSIIPLLGISLYLFLLIKFIINNNKIKKITFTNSNAMNYMLLGILIGISLWYAFFDLLPNSKFDKYDIIFVVALVLVDATFILFLLFGQNELKSSIFRGTLISFLLCMTWLGGYITIEVFSELSNSFTVFGIAGLGSSVLIFMWIVLDIKVNKFFNFFFSLSIFLMASGLLIYAVIGSYNVVIFSFLKSFKMDQIVIIVIFLSSFAFLFLNAMNWRRILAAVNRKNRKEIRISKKGEQNV